MPPSSQTFPTDTNSHCLTHACHRVCSHCPDTHLFMPRFAYHTTTDWDTYPCTQPFPHWTSIHTSTQCPLPPTLGTTTLSVHNCGNFPGEVCKWPHPQRARRDEAAGPSRRCRAGLVSTRTYEAYPRCPKTGRSLHPPSKTFQVYRGLSGVQSYLRPRGLQDVLLSQSCVLGKAPSAGRVGGVYIPRKGEAVRSLDCPPPVISSKTHLCTLCRCVYVSARSPVSSPMLSSTDTNPFCIPACTSVTCPGKLHFRVKGHHASFYLQREMQPT